MLARLLRFLERPHDQSHVHQIYRHIRTDVLALAAELNPHYNSSSLSRRDRNETKIIFSRDEIIQREF